MNNILISRVQKYEIFYSKMRPIFVREPFEAFFGGAFFDGRVGRRVFFGATVGRPPVEHFGPLQPLGGRGRRRPSKSR